MSNHPALKSKRITTAAILSLALAGSATFALASGGDGASSNSTSASASASPNAAAGGNSAAATSQPTSASKKSGTPSPSANEPAQPTEASSMESELQQLRELLEAQAQQLQAQSQQIQAQGRQMEAQQQHMLELEAALHPGTPGPVAGSNSSAFAATPGATASDAGNAAPLALSLFAADPSQQAQAQTPQDLSNRIGNLESRLKNFGPFIFSGDFRLRDEPIFGGPANQSLDQDRERFRLRFNVTAKLDEDFAGGFSLASGDINDPTSTNQTVTGFYTRKAIAIDKAFVDYTPHQWHALTLVGGKFAYPWYNTELTWDKDLNPEGVDETLAWNFDTVPVLKKFAVVGFELPYAQVARTATATDQSLVSSIVYGGQIQTQWRLLSRLKFGAYSGFYNWHDADSIAFALAKANSKNPQTPLTGLLPLGTGNAVQNSIVTTTETSFITVGGVNTPTGVTTVTNAQFASKFALFDNIARFDVTTPSDRWPIAIIGDYVQNTEACANLPNIEPLPATTAPSTKSPGEEFSQSTNFPCNSHQRRAYWAEAQVGRGLKKGDWQFDYTRMFIEREAVLSNFDYSDIRQGSNVSEHRAMVIYQLQNNVQLSWTGLFGRPLNFDSSNPPEDFLKRLQFDVIYTF